MEPTLRVSSENGVGCLLIQCCGKTNLLDALFSESQTGAQCGCQLLASVGLFFVLIKTGTKMHTAEVGTYWSVRHFMQSRRKKRLDDALENTPALNNVLKGGINPYYVCYSAVLISGM